MLELKQIGEARVDVRCSQVWKGVSIWESRTELKVKLYVFLL
jgi:hypothetical protein